MHCICAAACLSSAGGGQQCWGQQQGSSPAAHTGDVLLAGPYCRPRHAALVAWLTYTCSAQHPPSRATPLHRQDHPAAPQHSAAGQVRLPVCSSRTGGCRLCFQRGRHPQGVLRASCKAGQLLCSMHHAVTHLDDEPRSALKLAMCSDTELHWPCCCCCWSAAGGLGSCCTVQQDATCSVQLHQLCFRTALRMNVPHQR
jgi:hypothetical protein